MVKYPKIFSEIDVISLQQINIRNGSNVVAPDGYVLGQSTGKALMLPLDYLFNYVSTPINASLWANYPAVSTIDVSGNNIINVNSLNVGINNNTLGANSMANGEGTNSAGYASHAEGVSNVSFGNFSHAAGSNCSTIGTGSFAHGLNVNTTGNFSVGFGASNEADANASLVIGIAARAKIPGSMTYAAGGFAVPAPAGTAQTAQLNLLTSTTPSVENALKYNTYIGTASNIRINIGDPYYYLNKVEFTLTGYESKPSGGGGGAGLGLYSASYGFYVYWDIQNPRVAYIVDQNSASSATSGGNITLVATSAKNLLTPGSDTVTVKGYMTADASGADYALTVESTGYNANWLAQLKIGDLMVSNV